jgi:hypothetical protein
MILEAGGIARESLTAGMGGETRLISQGRNLPDMKGRTPGIAGVPKPPK